MKRLILQQDTREQAPWLFAGYDVDVIIKSLSEGDYAALLGGEIVGLVERKSGTDFRGSVTHGRDRFERELQRLAYSGVPCCIIVEDSLENMCLPTVHTKAHPASIVNSGISFFPKYGVPVFYCNSVEGAEYHAYHFLKFCVKYAEIGRAA